jgi:hypothetical protein
MDSGIAGAVAGYLVLQAEDVLLCLSDPSLSPCHLSIQFGDFEYRKRLALMDPVTDIHVDVTDVSRDFSMNIYFLEWLEDAGDGELIRDVSGMGRGYGYRGIGGSSFVSGCLIAMSAMQEVEQQ